MVQGQRELKGIDARQGQAYFWVGSGMAEDQHTAARNADHLGWRLRCHADLGLNRLQDRFQCYSDHASVDGRKGAKA